MAKLKVFRTAIGFHDAYVAAPSRKAALAAWGAEKDLFAMGAAEVVTDAKLTAAPLASPGEVIRTVRGSLSEHLSAAGKQQPPRPRPRDRPAEGKPAKPAKPRAALPRPSRDKLEDAEQALAKARTEAEAEGKDLARREADLAKERKAMETRQRRAAEALQAKLDDARTNYDEAMDRWRAS